MRAPLLSSLVLLLTLLVSGCSFPTPLAKQSSQGGQALSSSSVTPPAASSSASPTPSSATPPTASSSDQASAIKAVIQRADEAQRQAFEQNAPTIMRDTATASYYQQLIQINSDLAGGDVSDIKLIKIEWGKITVNGATAEATAYETWRTTLKDGSASDDREQNLYTLVKEQGAWKIQNDDQPNQSPGPGTPNPAAPAPPGYQA